MLCASAAAFPWLTWPGSLRGAEPAQPPQPTSTALQQPKAEQPVTGLESDVHLDKTPPRRTTGLDLVKMGWTYDCMECHRFLEAQWHHDAPMVEHQQIKLKHGNNRFCLNCHHPTNRNAFVDYDGSEIPEGGVVQLCAKCHGPTYRDWDAGVHGRENGFWDVNRGPRTKLLCIQCHDPHAPGFQPMKPLPAPTYPRRAAHPPSLTESKQKTAAGHPAASQPLP